MSWLTVLHIDDRAALLTECHRVLQPGAGMFYAADFYDKGLEEGERKTLADDVDCHYLPPLARYAPMKAACSSQIATCLARWNKRQLSNLSPTRIRSRTPVVDGMTLGLVFSLFVGLIP